MSIDPQSVAPVPDYPWRHAIVVGASSGIGEAIARQLGASGCSVVLVARRVERLEAVCAGLMGESTRCVALAHDVRHTAEVPAVFQQATTTLGGLDLVVYASGIMPRPERGETETQRDLRVIETNLSGAVAWLNEAAERFAIAGDGTIVGISSVAGERGRRPNAVYGATKAALTSYLSSLRSRLSGRGVTVLTVKPGLVRTPMLGIASQSTLIPVVSADQAAREILNAAKAGKRVVYVPGWWRPVMALVRAIPAPIFERLPF